MVHSQTPASGSVPEAFLMATGFQVTNILGFACFFKSHQKFSMRWKSGMYQSLQNLPGLYLTPSFVGP